jgi:hypothetical protein
MDKNIWTTHLDSARTAADEMLRHIGALTEFRDQATAEIATFARAQGIEVNLDAASLRARGLGRVANGYYIFDDGTIVWRAPHTEHEIPTLDGKRWLEFPEVNQ